MLSRPRRRERKKINGRRLGKKVRKDIDAEDKIKKENDVKDGKKVRKQAIRSIKCRERERDTHERYTVRWKLRACWWSRSRTDARAGGSITSPMIYPTESSLLLRCEEEKKQESKSKREREREGKKKRILEERKKDSCG